MAFEKDLVVTYVSSDAYALHRATPEAAGLDLRSPKDEVIPAKGRVLIDILIAVKLPVGTYGRIAPRSGLALDHFIDVGAGVIDRDYEGSIKVLLFNFSDVDYPIKAGRPIAQLICEKCLVPDVVVDSRTWKNVERPTLLRRGDQGFGSTGNN